MIPAHIEEKLRMFRKETYVILREEEQTELKEKKKEGEVNLMYTAQGDVLVFSSPEKYVLPYLDEEQKGARACADVFLYKMAECGKCDLHIMEFKKTIDTSSIGKSQWQFTMGIYNARGLAEFLGIEIRNIYLHTSFRKDKLAGGEDSPLIALRASNNREAVRKIRQWKEDKYELRVDGENRVFQHQKIQLDSAGNGSVSI